MRLEGRADLLEATRVRYTALIRMLGAWFWRERLRRNIELLREVAQTEEEVAAVIHSVRLRAAAEGWPVNRGPIRLISDVERLGVQLAQRVARRRVSTGGGGLAQALFALEAEVLSEPRTFFYPGSVWAAANELLPRNHPDLRALCAAATALVPLASRPDPANGAFALSPDECLTFVAALEQADPSVRSLRARLATLERTGTVLALLDKKAALAPRVRPRSGAEQFVFGAGWTNYAWARAARWLAPWVRPLELREEEYGPVLEWIGRARSDPSEPLYFRGAPRDALLETCLRSSEVLLGRRLIPSHPAALRAAAERAEAADRGEALLVIGALVASGRGVTGSLAGFSLVETLSSDPRMAAVKTA